MKTKFLLSCSLTLTTLFTVSVSLFPKVNAQSNNLAQEIQFACNQIFEPTTNQYIFTTSAWNSQYKKPIITWKKENFSNVGFDPQRRCEIVSSRFQQAYENNSLKFITYGTMNGQSVICTSRRVGGDCDTLLLTLLPQDDALAVLEQLSDILLGYANAPLEQSSEESVYEVGDRIYVKVNIENFLNEE